MEDRFKVKERYKSDKKWSINDVYLIDTKREKFVCACTGIRDQENKDIFENDVLRSTGDGVIREKKPFFHVVFWNKLELTWGVYEINIKNGSYELTGNKLSLYDYLIETHGKFVVIFNIFDC